ncbi:MAG TPA: hypothetical protein VMB04_07860 [Mycobacterium sp.]|nr:hypothetical protein [Mycobacterium sp.]
MGRIVHRAARAAEVPVLGRGAAHMCSSAAPAAVVISFELFGHRHLAEVLAGSLDALGSRA